MVSTMELKGLKGLRNLDSLLTASDASVSKLETIQNLRINSLVRGKYQPRQQFSEDSLAELADSIRAQGIIQPLIVRAISQNNYEIIAGERRWRAAKIAGLEKVPAIVRDIKDNIALAFSLIENIQRDNLNPIEEAAALWQLKEEFSMTHSDIAQMVGRSRTAITNTLRLLALNDFVKERLMHGDIDMGHARALLALESDEQTRITLKIIENKLTVRETEKLINHIKTQGKGNATKKLTNSYDYLSSELSKKFSSNVTVQFSKNGTGKIVILVDSIEKINWLIEHINID